MQLLDLLTAAAEDLPWNKVVHAAHHVGVFDEYYLWCSSFQRMLWWRDSDIFKKDV